MTTGERYVSWNPLPNLLGEFTLDTVVDDQDGLHISLMNDTGRAIRIDFRSALAYRLTGRALCPAEWMAHDVLSGRNGAIFVVEESGWIKDLGERISDSATHFACVLESEVIEILTDETPNAAWLNTLFGDAV